MNLNLNLNMAKSHFEVVAEIQSRLSTVLQDPLLSDIGPGITPEDLRASIALLRGQALTLQLRLYDDQSIRNELATRFRVSNICVKFTFSSSGSTRLHCA